MIVEPGPGSADVAARVQKDIELNEAYRKSPENTTYALIREDLVWAIMAFRAAGAEIGIRRGSEVPDVYVRWGQAVSSNGNGGTVNCGDIQLNGEEMKMLTGLIAEEENHDAKALSRQP